jgi:stage V sporulation protein K
MKTIKFNVLNRELDVLFFNDAKISFFTVPCSIFRTSHKCYTLRGSSGIFGKQILICDQALIFSVFMGYQFDTYENVMKCYNAREKIVENWNFIVGQFNGNWDRIYNYLLENNYEAFEKLRASQHIKDDFNEYIENHLNSSSIDNMVSNSPADEEAVHVEKIEDVLAELESFTGMESIKKDVQSLINLLKIQKQRENQGLTVIKPSLHMVFTGPPGTGKTTVARIMGRVFKALGILKKGHIVETDRSGLVAGYVGQTAIKVDEVIQKSLDGILFIDEAYTLSPAGGNDSFGQEAIDTLLKRMEDNRDSLVVIVAGYEEDMQRFIESNPGFKSRFNKYINFYDYKPEELTDLFASILNKNKYIASQDLLERLNSEFSELYHSRTKSFGNARVVRNLFEKIVENQSNRLASVSGELTETDLQTLISEDFPV